jgi:hypothetical protein
MKRPIVGDRCVVTNLAPTQEHISICLDCQKRIWIKKHPQWHKSNQIAFYVLMFLGIVSFAFFIH